MSLLDLAHRLGPLFWWFLAGSTATACWAAWLHKAEAREGPLWLAPSALLTLGLVVDAVLLRLDAGHMGYCINNGSLPWNAAVSAQAMADFVGIGLAWTTGVTVLLAGLARRRTRLALGVLAVGLALGALACFAEVSLWQSALARRFGMVGWSSQAVAAVAIPLVLASPVLLWESGPSPRARWTRGLAALACVALVGVAALPWCVSPTQQEDLPRILATGVPQATSGWTPIDLDAFWPEEQAAEPDGEWRRTVRYRAVPTGSSATVLRPQSMSSAAWGGGILVRDPAYSAWPQRFSILAIHAVVYRNAWPESQPAGSALVLDPTWLTVDQVVATCAREDCVLLWRQAP
ncbi:MAG: hypothetical protein GY913_17310 [Proteobacteria bacterium]|nr:hypothetical protein [Pseudomonadota bacterium]MCP4918665.1 hypothetical protein [Pseudomonadota bacterium]